MKKYLFPIIFAFFAQTCFATVAIDGSNSATISSPAQTCSFPLTVSSGLDRAILVGVSYSDNYIYPHGVANVTYPGATFERVGSALGTSHAHTELWIGIAPNSGTANIVVTMLGSGQVVCGGISLTGVDQANPTSGIVTKTITSNTVSATTMGATGGLAVGVFSCDSCSLVSQNKTVKWNSFVFSGNSNAVVGSGSTASGSGDITFTWNADWNGPSLTAVSAYINPSSQTTPTPAPTATISSSPTSITQGSTATITWSSTNATACTLSSGQSGTTGSFTTPSLTTNTTYTVTCTGTGGTTSQSATVSVAAQVPTQDITLPSTPTSLTATAISSSQINLSWNASTDNVGVTGYKVYRGGTQIATTNTTTSYSNTGLSPSTTYTYTVQALDATGNASLQSNTASVTTPSVTTPTPISVPINTSSATSPVPPMNLVVPGRTFDPSDQLNTPIGSGTKYYVDGVNGNDTNNGTSLSTAFKTIQKGVSALKSAGDTVLIRGGLYRERVSIMSKNGPSASNPFVVGPYNGEKVIIDGSPQLGGWTLYDAGNNIYRAATSFVVGDVVINNEPFYREVSLTSLQATPTVSGVPSNRRYYAGSGYVYVRFDGGSPANQDTGVIEGVRDNNDHGFYLWDSSNYVIYGLTIRFARNYGIYAAGNSKNNRFERNTLAFNGYTGISPGSNAQVVKNFVYHNMMLNWPRGENGYAWGNWGAGIGVQSMPNTVVDGNISYKNGGEGILTYLSNNVTFKNNVTADNWSVNLYFDNSTDGVIDGNVSLCHTPTDANRYNNGENDVTTIIRQRPIGIMTADEKYGTGGSSLNNVVISNNVIIHCRFGLQHYGQALNSGLKNVKVINNTIIMPTSVHAKEENQPIFGINIPYNSGNNIGSSYQNNIIIGGYYNAQYDTGYLMHSTNNLAMENFRGLTIDHNLFYHPNMDLSTAKLFKWGGPNWGSAMTYASWRELSKSTSTGLYAQGDGDILGDPLLINRVSDNQFDKAPLSSSPVINKGVVTSTLIDYVKNTRPQGGSYDIGAFESSGAISTNVVVPVTTTTQASVTQVTVTTQPSTQSSTQSSTPAPTPVTTQQPASTITPTFTPPSITTQNQPSTSKLTVPTGTIHLPATTQVNTNIKTAQVSQTQSTVLTRNLVVGSRGQDVRALQKFLNQQGFIITSKGTGSSGNESTYFGPATKKALAKFQAANGISPASGYFGPMTRALVIKMSGM